MPHSTIPRFKDSLKADASASLVVFLVALPLCLGIALASGAPLASGLVAGVIGGIVVSLISRSPMSVTGPAAGLVIIVLDSIRTLGSFEVFLLAVMIAGLIQILFGVLRLGILGEYVPAAVVKGMLAGIGVVIILKQIPHALGRDSDFEGNLRFIQQMDQQNSLSAIIQAIAGFNPQALAISLVGLVILFGSDFLVKKRGRTFIIPPALIAVTLGAIMASLGERFFPLSALNRTPGHFVELPLSGLLTALPSPDFSVLFSSPNLLIVSVTLAVIASIETLLSIEATDKIDPYRRVSPPNRELLAQGVGNILSGLCGGLPVTAVIIRSSANIYSGGRTKLSAILHGVFLLLAILLIPALLNKIPLCILAVVLIHVGYKLADINLFKRMYGYGQDQFLPFLVTILGIVFTDLLAGVLIGLALSFFYVLRLSHHSAVTLVKDDSYTLLRINKDLSFLNKKEIKSALSQIPDGAEVMIDGTKAMYIDYDIYDLLRDFEQNASHRSITLNKKNIEGKVRPIIKRIQIRG
jgi:MFS superfamily sulfate permease-like transporter